MRIRVGRIGRWQATAAAAAVAAIAAAATLAATAAAGPAAQSATKRIPGVPCSVTGKLRVEQASKTLSYSGGVSCQGGAGEKTIDIVPQVGKLVGHKRHWYSIGGAAFYQGPVSSGRPLRVKATARAVPGHTYRLLAVARVVLADGATGTATACAACDGSAPALSLGGLHPFLARPSTSGSLGASGCALTQDGLLFTLVNRGYVLNYGAFVACLPTGAGSRSLTVCAQTSAHRGSGTAWLTISGSCMSTGSTGSAPLVVSTARTTYLGHGYRIKATATVSYRGRTSTATVRSAAGTP
jgi:hypothetical protein